MATSEFFTGLSSGLFGEQAKQREVKEKRNMEEKSSALKLLSGMVDQVDPDSRPTLLRHIGDVMGLKGKERGVWARLTGADLESDRGALNSKLGEILGQVQAPYKAEPKKELTGFTQAAGFPVPVGQTIPAPPRDPRSMYLRDPLGEEMNQLKARYGLQRQMGFDKLELQNELTRQRQLEVEQERQEGRLEVEDAKAVNRAMGPLLQRAYTLSRGQAPSREQFETAALAVEKETGLKADKLLAQIGYLQARTNKTETEVLSGGKPMTEAQNETLARQDRTDAQTTFKQWTDQRGLADAVGKQLQAVYSNLQSIAASTGATYDATRSTFLNAQGQPDQDLNTFYAQQIEQVRKLQREKDTAMVKLTGLRDTLANTYGDYYNVFEGPWTVTPKVYDATSGQYKRTGTTTAPTTAGQLTPSIGESTTIIGTQSRPATAYQVGQVISAGGRKYKVVDVQPPSDRYPFGNITAMPTK